MFDRQTMMIDTWHFLLRNNCICYQKLNVVFTYDFKPEIVLFTSSPEEVV